MPVAVKLYASSVYRYINHFVVTCNICSSDFSVLPVDDYLICSQCTLHHDLLLSRIQKRLHYPLSPQLDLFFLEVK
jgi:hypothetical protein